jgi:DMSO/TMAO reductase YedYZ heme-binding membrane subunit
MTNNWWWFIARGAGLSALVTLTLAVVLGSVGSIRSRSPATRVIGQYLHRTAAVLGLLLIALHVTAILMDSLAHVGLSGAFVPLTSAYRHTAVALGTVALYLLLLVAALGAARGRMAGTRTGVVTWRAIHCLSYLAWVAAVSHGLLAGTDRGQRWVQVLDVICILAVVAAVGIRLSVLDDDSVGRPRPTPAAGR